MAEKQAGTESPLAVLHDVAVIGGGLIGAAVALGAARQGWQVLLLDRAAPDWAPGSLGMDLRSVAVSPASQTLLDGLGVWRELRAVPYTHMHVWEERGTRAIDFDAAEVARGELGWIVENGPLVALLWQRLRALDNVAVHTGDRLVGLEATAGEVGLRLRSEDQDRSARARLVIGADGARSSVRALLGVSAETFDTGHHALATVVRTARPHHGWAYQRFLLDGPLALLPGTAPRHCAVVWSQPPETARRRAALAEQDFCAELNNATEGCLGEVEATDQRLVFPLQQMLVSTFQPDERVLLVGDAARVLHPLAGLGANLGFEDVAELLAQLQRLGGRGDPGVGDLWHGFARRRHWRSRMMVDLMGGLRRVYARSDPLFQWLRNVGVGWLDSVAPVKRQIIREALGLGSLARPPTDG